MRASSTLTGTALGACVGVVVAVVVADGGRRRRQDRASVGRAPLEQEQRDGDHQYGQQRDNHPELALDQIPAKCAHPWPPVVVPPGAEQLVDRGGELHGQVRRAGQGNVADAQQWAPGVDLPARHRNESVELVHETSRAL